MNMMPIAGEKGIYGDRAGCMTAAANSDREDRRMPDGRWPGKAGTVAAMGMSAVKGDLKVILKVFHPKGVRRFLAQKRLAQKRLTPLGNAAERSGGIWRSLH